MESKAMPWIMGAIALVLGLHDLDLLFHENSRGIPFVLPSCLLAFAVTLHFTNKTGIKKSMESPPRASELKDDR